MSFLSGFNKRKAIKYGTTKPASNLTAFPALFKILNDANIGAELGSTKKFAFTLSDGTTQVPYGPLSYIFSGGNGNLIARAKYSLSSSASTGDTLGYVYYDSTATDQSNKSGVLDSNTIGYWPMEEDPTGSAPQILDWSGNAYNGTSGGSMISGDLVAGQVANGISFDGVDDNLSLANTPNVTGTSQTLTLLAYPTDTGNGDRTLIQIGSVTLRYAFGVLADPFILFNGQNGPDFNGLVFGTASGGSFNVTVNTWNHIVCTTDGSTIRAYINGAESKNGSTSGTLSDTGTYLIAKGSNGVYFQGILDEISIASIARSADWIAFDYQNQFNNSNTFTFGSEELSSGPKEQSFGNIFKTFIKGR